MLSKLAIKNVTTQFRYYLMYVVSMTFSVMVYYSFISMSYDQDLMSRASQDMRIDAGLKSGSMLILLFIVIFMLSANTFFVKRRKREIGLYSLLGMRRRQIASLFFVENILLGLLSLVLGLILGIVFSKLFAMLLMKAMYVAVTTSIIVSLEAIKHTVVVFVIILIAISIRTGFVVYRYKLITLFKAEETIETPLRLRWYHWLLGILGLSLLGLGYTLAHHFISFMMYMQTHTRLDVMAMLVSPLIILGLCVVGTYLLFDYFLLIVLVLIRKWKRFYYRDINMVTAGNLGFQLKKKARILATIAVLSGTAIAAIGGAASVQSFTLAMVDTINPVSYSVSPDNRDRLVKEIGEQEMEEEPVAFKFVGGEIGMFVNGNYEKRTGFHNVMSQSNYQSLSHVIPQLSPIPELGKKEIMLLVNEANQFAMDEMMEPDETLLLGNQGELQLIGLTSDKIGNLRDMRFPVPTVVVSDETYHALAADYDYGYSLINLPKKELMTDADEAKKLAELFPDTDRIYVYNRTREDKGRMIDTVEEMPKEELEEKYPDTAHYSSRLLFSNRYPYQQSLRMNMGLLVYVAVFLGVVFMLATGSIIMLKQLSEAEEEVGRYEMLRKIGTPKSIIKKSIYKQNAVIFFVPLFVSLCHAIFALEVLYALMAKTDMALTYLSMIFLVTIYVLFYLGTSASYYKTIQQEG